MASRSRIAHWVGVSVPGELICRVTSSNWSEVASTTLRIPEDGVYSIRWVMWVEPRERFLFWQRKTRHFEVRIEVGGQYVYVYTPGLVFESHGYAPARLKAGSCECYVLARAIGRAAVTFRNVEIEVHRLEGNYAGKDD